MITTEVRLDMQLISPTILAHYMEHRGFTVRGLAAAVTVELQKTTKTRGRKLHPSYIGHLRSGNRTYCDPAIAKAIERLLDAPAGSLFVAKMTTVQRERRRVA